jgi:hypothetical protein
MYEFLDFDRKLTDGVKAIEGREFKIDSGGKLSPAMLAGAFNLPWVFINHDARKKFCWFWNQVCTRVFDIIPSNCRFNCWKTVLKPNNVKELFECYEILKVLDLPSKIGMDLRDYTHGAWAGFVYGDSLDDGRAQYKIIREAMPEDVSVILKRGCTEMERLADSNTWGEMKEEDAKLEEKLLDRFTFNERHFFQSKWQVEEIKQNWIKRAIQIGDPTVKETVEKYSDDPNIWKKLVVISDTYHEEKEK